MTTFPNDFRSISRQIDEGSIDLKTLMRFVKQAQHAGAFLRECCSEYAEI